MGQDMSEATEPPFAALGEDRRREAMARLAVLRPALEGAVPLTRVAAEEALQRHAEGTALFVDVRDSAAIAKTGTIAGAQRVPRGFLEFAADEATPHHNPALTKDAAIYLVCGAGGQVALAGRTLQEMGFTQVHNIGGIGDWKSASGPMED